MSFNNQMKNIIKNILLFLPIIYSIIKLRSDIYFYIISSIIYLVLSLFYFIYKNKNYYSYILQVVISCIFLDLTFHNIDFKLFINNFTLINIKMLIIIIFLLLFGFFLRAYKWRYLLDHIKPIRVISLFKAVIVGYMMNSILPARAGEVYRAFFLNKLEKISKSSVFGTIVLERVFDGLSIGICIIYVLLINIIQEELVYRAGIIGIGVYIFAIIFIVIFYFKKDVVVKIMKKVLFFFPSQLMKKIMEFLNSFYEGLHIFRNLKRLIFFTLFTIIMWVLFLYTNYLFLESMGMFQIINSAVSQINFTILMVVCIAIGVSIPSAPGAVGPFQFSIFMAFSSVIPALAKSQEASYDGNLVASFSMYIWLVSILIVVILGFYILTREHVKLKIK